MARALRIPGLVDLVRTADPAEIRLLNDDPRLDRRFTREAPLLNRLVLGRVRSVLQLDGRPLPPVAPRDAPGRREKQAALEARLTGLGGTPPVDAETLAALALYVRGQGPGEIGPLAQQAIGRLFVPCYKAQSGSWAAARRINGAARSLLSPLALIRRLTGGLDRDRRHLAEKVGGDESALHATAVAVHNLADSLGRMRRLAAGPGSLARYSPQEAAALCLVAPATVLRQAGSRGTNAAASFRPGTMVLFQLETARARTLRQDVSFLTGSWSACPAHRWAPALLAAVWAQAAGGAAQ